MQSDHEPMVDVQTVADYLNLHPDTIYSYARSGDIPAHKIGGRWRFSLTEIRAHLNRKRDPWVRADRAQRNSRMQ